MSVGPDYEAQEGYEAPNGVSVMAGVADDAGSRDPSSTTISGAVSNAMAQMSEIASDTLTDHVGDLVNLPTRSY
jgi:CRISPR/Cas system CSM-associated protein Csm4 (group 5 of RAMP superfamily)